MSTFKDALSNFTTEVAYKESIRRLYDLGKSPEEIHSLLLYPVSISTINKVILEYEEKKILPKTKFVEDVDNFGRKTLRKVNE